MPKPDTDQAMSRSQRRRRDDIVQAALTVFDRDGYEAAKMADIAREAEVAKGTLYLYFDTKAALLEEVRMNIRSFLDGDDDGKLDGDSPFCYWFGPTNCHRKWIKGSGKEHWGLEPEDLLGKLPKFLPDVPVVREDFCDYLGEVQAFDAGLGVLLRVLEERGLADNTIVLYTTDNGPHKNTWPDAGLSPFRNEKNSNWEGAFRVPCAIRWPEKIKAGGVSNEIVSGLDWLPTLMAAVGEDDIKSKLLTGHQAAGKTFKVHLDGYNILPHLTGKAEKSPRESFFYFNDDGQLVGMRFQNWKLVFLEQRAEGLLRVWAEPFTTLRLPKIYDLRADPYEQADITSNTYYDWILDHAFLLVPAQQYAGKFLETFKEYPPRQKPASFNLEEVMDKLSEGATH